LDENDIQLVNFGDVLGKKSFRTARNQARLSRWRGTIEDEETEEPRERTESDNERDFQY
jgi:hypothetical protein